MKVPNPGSDEACELGCTCPVLDNAHGRGCGRVGEDGKPLFWVSGNCPIHSKKKETNDQAR